MSGWISVGASNDVSVAVASVEVPSQKVSSDEVPPAGVSSVGVTSCGSDRNALRSIREKDNSVFVKNYLLFSLPRLAALTKVRFIRASAPGKRCVAPSASTAWMFGAPLLLWRGRRWSRRSSRGLVCLWIRSSLEESVVLQGLVNLGGERLKESASTPADLLTSALEIKMVTAVGLR